MSTARKWWTHPRVGPVLKVIVAYLVLVDGAVQLAFGKLPVLGIGFGASAIPPEIIIVGAVIGSLVALVAMGLILVYRANRIINFAQAQLGSVPAVVALFLMAKRGMPYIFAIPIVLIGGALLGAVTEVAVIRRFSKAPRLILTVATIGVGLLLLILEVYSKYWVGGALLNSASLSFPTPLSGVQLRVGAVTFNGNHLIAIVVTAGVMLALGAFFQFTDMGIAVRASAENGERASLLGIPVKRVSTVVWILAATMSAIGVFLRGPLVGLPLEGFVGPSVLLYGLAVAVMARMESLPTAFAAGMFVGIVQQAAVYSTGRPAMADVTMFVVVVVVLLAQRGRLSRAFEVGASTWQAVKEVRPIPAELRRLPEVRRGLTVLGVMLGLLVLGAPNVLGGQTGQATIVVIYAMIGVSLVILTGWAGQISLGQYAIAAMGAATAGGLAANHHVDFFVTLAVGALAGAFLAVLVGLPALRIQGMFLAVTTLAFAFAVQALLTRQYVGWLLPRPGQLVNRPVLWGRLDLETASDIGPLHITADAKFYYLCVMFLGLVLALGRSFRNNRSGRVLITVRDNPRMAQSFGVNLASSRLMAFAISGSIAGLAGALLAYQNRAIASNAFPPERSIEIFVLTVIGGVGSLPGALLGAVYVRVLPLLPGLRNIENISLLTSGLGLLVLLSFMPGGLGEALYRVRDRWLRSIAGRRGIRVPSLVADSLVLEPTAAVDALIPAPSEETLPAGSLT